MIACESTRLLLKKLDSKEMIVTVREVLTCVPEMLDQYNVELQSPQQLRFCYTPSITDSGKILSSIQQAELNVIDVVTKETELEDIFISLTTPGSFGTPKKDS